MKLLDKKIINKLITLKERNEYKKIEFICNKYIGKNFFDCSIYNMLGIALKSQGKIDESITKYIEGIKEFSDCKDLYNNLGILYKDIRQYDKAIIRYKQAISIDPNYEQAYNNLGTAYIEIGKIQEAIDAYKRAIEINDNYFGAYNNLGLAYYENEDYDASRIILNKAITIEPDNAAVYNTLGNVYYKTLKIKQAIECYKKAILYNQEYIEAYNNFGNALNYIGNVEQAIKNFKKAIALDPNYPFAYNNMAILYGSLGDSRNSISNYEKAIQLQPDYIEAYFNLSRVKKFSSDDPLIHSINLINESNITDKQKKSLYATKAKIYEDLNDVEKMIKYLHMGNKLQKKILNYNFREDTIKIKRIKNWLNNNKLDASKQVGIKLIFIVGMPRSGTSLVEQIISSHSDVFGAGELEYCNIFATEILADMILSKNNSAMTVDQINKFQQKYISKIKELTTNTIITDKMPLNFQWINIIIHAFPNAKIINLNRNSIATCWSNYKTFFSTQGNNFVYDQKDIAKFYLLYKDLMQFWHKKFPDKIYDISYEALVENQKEETRKLLEYCELDWDKNCLNFHKNKRVVKTASSTQIRKKIYKGSNEAWKKYEKYMQPMIKILKEGLDNPGEYLNILERQTLQKAIRTKPTLPTAF